MARGVFALKTGKIGPRNAEKSVNYSNTKRVVVGCCLTTAFLPFRSLFQQLRVCVNRRVHHPFEQCKNEALERDGASEFVDSADSKNIGDRVFPGFGFI